MSVLGDLLKAVREKVERAVSLAPDRVKIRRRAAYFKQHDSLPFIVISPDAEAVGDWVMPGTVLMDYSVLVSVIDENGLVLEDLDATLDLRQTIRQALCVTTFDAVGETFDLRSYDPQPPFPPGAVDQAFDVSSQRFTWRHAESRTV